MKAIDQYGMPLRSKTRRKTKQPSDVMFKLRDPITKLFWGVSSPKEPVFNHVGKQWGSRQGAMANWAEYNFNRVVEDDDHPIELELVEFKVAVTQVGATADKSPDMTVAGLFAVTYKLDYDLNRFVKKLALDGYRFSHLLKCELNGELKMPPHITMRYHCVPISQSWGLGTPSIPASLPRVPKTSIFSGRFASQRSGGSHQPPPPQKPMLQDAHYIAVGTETDAIFLKMALSDHIVAIWDIAKMIAGEQHTAYLKAQ